MALKGPKLYLAKYFTLTLQKSRMLQIQGAKGEAVFAYREPLTTKEMRHPRLSRRVNNSATFPLFVDVISCGIQNKGSQTLKSKVFPVFSTLSHCCLCNVWVKLRPDNGCTDALGPEKLFIDRQGRTKSFRISTINRTVMIGVITFPEQQIPGPAPPPAVFKIFTSLAGLGHLSGALKGRGVPHRLFQILQVIQFDFLSRPIDAGQRQKAQERR